MFAVVSSIVFGGAYLISGAVALFGLFGLMRTRATRLPLPARETLGGLEPLLFPLDKRIGVAWNERRKALKVMIYVSIMSFYALLWVLLLFGSRQAAAIGFIEFTAGPVRWLGWGIFPDGIVWAAHLMLMAVLAVTLSYRAVSGANRFRCADGSWYYNYA